ncbi:MAG: T9SS type A sorting domain-containing protein [Candidatus Delongbacteria bacterium]|jgi:hypothetical protein|nr:T9SS type A sorting domain-containing protein [Candidatus Delongbacteria bacterium]
MKRLISLMIISLQLIVFSQFAGGSGTEDDPWLIRTASNLDSIRYFCGPDHSDKYFKQVYPIPLWSYGDSLWTPIGTDSLPFMGSFGVGSNGYDIWGMNIIDSLSNNLGLFGVIENATLMNIQLTGAHIIGQGYCGALVGKSTNSKISKCVVTDYSISATGNNIGGLIGKSENDSISICCLGEYNYIDSRISGLDNIGGLIGFCSSTIDNCFSWAPVVGNSYVGGFIGNSTNTDILNCYSSGDVEGIGSIGGFIGTGDSTSVLHSYWMIRDDLTDGFAEGRTSDEMGTEYGDNDSTYVGWDFENIWKRHYVNLWYSGPPIFYIGNIVGIENQKTALPLSAELAQNYPNPFNPTTTIRFNLNDQCNINLSIFNSKGELIQTLFKGIKDKGNHSINFDASNLNSGVYFYNLTSDDKTLTKKMLYLR